MITNVSGKLIDEHFAKKEEGVRRSGRAPLGFYDELVLDFS